MRKKCDIIKPICVISITPKTKTEMNVQSKRYIQQIMTRKSDILWNQKAEPSDNMNGNIINNLSLSN